MPEQLVHVGKVLVALSPASSLTASSAVEQAFGRFAKTLTKKTIPKKNVPTVIQGSNSSSVLTNAVRIVVRSES